MHFVELLQKLIAFPTVSAESNRALIDYLGEFLTPLGFHTQVFPSPDGRKANLLARIGPEKAGGLMLAGHTDVVPVEGQAWHSDPFQLVEKEGRLFGRGTSDMKGFLALALKIAQEIETPKLIAPLYLAFTYDEEVGCWGAKQLIAPLKEQNVQPQFVLIGEPTGMEVVTAHKGVRLIATQVKGRAAHSSRPDLGANAIVFAAELIRRLAEIIPDREDKAFSPPVSTYNVGTIRGGSAVNIIAEHCEFLWEVRPLPGVDAAQIHARWEQLARSLAAQKPPIQVTHRLEAEVPALAEEVNQKAAALVKTLLGKPENATAPFVTEAGLYQQAAIPAVVCGPGRVEQAHQPDEYVSVQEMQQYYAFLKRLIAQQISTHAKVF